MTNSLRRRILLALFTPALAIFAACDNPVRDDHDEVDVAGVELYTEAALTNRVAWTHGQGASMHWDGEIPHLHEGEEIALWARFVTSTGGTIALGGEYTVRSELANQADDGVTGAEGIVEIANHGNHVDIEGVEAGETHIVFMLWHGGHADWRSPAIAVEVEDH